MFCRNSKYFIVNNFHFVSINCLGYAMVYPTKFGMEDHTSSVVARETARLQCVSPGWWHEENKCPADSPRSAGKIKLEKLILHIKQSQNNMFSIIFYSHFCFSFGKGNPAPSPLSASQNGDCSYASCDIAEFYKMALYIKNEKSMLKIMNLDTLCNCLLPFFQIWFVFHVRKC